MPRDDWARTAREKAIKKARTGRNYGPINTRKQRKRKQQAQWPEKFLDDDKR